MAAGSPPAVRQGPVRESPWTKWAPLSGIAFIIFLAVGIILFSTPDADSATERIKSFYDEESNRTELIISGYLFALAGVSFLWFLGSLRARLLEAEGGHGRLTSIVFASGIVFTAMLMTAGGSFMFVAGEITFADAPVHPEIQRVLPDIGWTFLLIGGGFSAIAMIAGASVLSLRTGVFPAWVAWLGIIAAVVLLVGALVFPFAVLLIWVGVVSLALLASNGVSIPFFGSS